MISIVQDFNEAKIPVDSSTLPQGSFEGDENLNMGAANPASVMLSTIKAV